jgi:hypothetical protein
VASEAVDGDNTIHQVSQTTVATALWSW